MHVSGKAWLFGDNIDTNLILPNHAHFLPPDEQARLLFSALRPDWAAQTARGDIVIAGRNFGMGSQRPSARAFRALGISCIVADSANGLFFRNCINFGFLVLECPGVSAAFKEGDIAEVSLDPFEVRNATTGVTLPAVPLPPALVAILAAGGVYALLEKEQLIVPR
jgi:3-isopropylmalate/(R)-2-methylmalate dehydratase small subunit